MLTRTEIKDIKYTNEPFNKDECLIQISVQIYHYRNYTCCNLELPESASSDRSGFLFGLYLVQESLENSVLERTFNYILPNAIASKLVAILDYVTGNLDRNLTGVDLDLKPRFISVETTAHNNHVYPYLSEVSGFIRQILSYLSKDTTSAEVQVSNFNSWGKATGRTTTWTPSLQSGKDIASQQEVLNLGSFTKADYVDVKGLSEEKTTVAFIDWLEKNIKNKTFKRQRGVSDITVGATTEDIFRKNGSLERVNTYLYAKSTGTERCFESCSNLKDIPKNSVTLERLMNRLVPMVLSTTKQTLRIYRTESTQSFLGNPTPDEVMAHINNNIKKVNSRLSIVHTVDKTNGQDVADRYQIIEPNISSKAPQEHYYEEIEGIILANQVNTSPDFIGKYI